MSVGCAFESRRGHFHFFWMTSNPPGGDDVSRLRVRVAPGAFSFFWMTSNRSVGDDVSRLRDCPCGVQASRAGGIIVV